MPLSRGLLEFAEVCWGFPVRATQANLSQPKPTFFSDVGTSRADDDVHLEFAAQNGCALLTKDIKDFQRLHIDWQSQGRSHSGIFLVHYDGDVTKDMKPRDIVRAIGNLLAFGIPIANEIHRLNHWR